MEGLQAARDLLDDAAHGLEVGPRVVGHPLRQRLALDVFHRDVQEAALARARAGLEHVRAVHAPRDPFLHQEALEMVRVALQIGGGRLQHDARRRFRSSSAR